MLMCVRLLLVHPSVAAEAEELAAKIPKHVERPINKGNIISYIIR